MALHKHTLEKISTAQVCRVGTGLMLIVNRILSMEWDWDKGQFMDICVARTYWYIHLVLASMQMQVGHQWKQFKYALDAALEHFLQLVVQVHANPAVQDHIQTKYRALAAFALQGHTQLEKKQSHLQHARLVMQEHSRSPLEQQHRLHVLSVWKEHILHKV